jgi:hypothetical protein
MDIIKFTEYLKEAISAVYLGAKINPDIEKEIKEWGESKEIPIHKMKLSEKIFCHQSVIITNIQVREGRCGQGRPWW